jgi:limonene-1,2-epoxide hydrolase
MRHLILCSVVYFTLSGCNSNRDAENSSDKATANLEVIEKYRQAVEKNDLNTFDTLLSDDYIGYGPSVGDSITKSQAVTNWKNEVSNLYQSMEYTRSESYPITIKSGPTSGDWVVNWAYLTIKYKDGRGPVNVWVNATYKIKDGKIVRSRTFYNEADVLRQLGYDMVYSKPNG